ncbi:MAG: IclR family transcriptional regulator [Clostridia bacterium]|nr:IclR family transcriptional regulator [Clostridia bacterium]
MNTSSPSVNSIDRALKVIETLHEADGELGVAEIARAIDEYQSTVFRTLATLEARGFVYQNNQTSKYGLGMKLYTIGMGIKNNSVIVKIIEPFAKELCERFGETVNVSIRDYECKDDYYSLLMHQESKKGQVLGVSQTVGNITLCYYSAVGKALLAYSDDFSTERILRGHFKRFTENSITDPDEILKELYRIRRQGYALDNEEQEIGLFCVACPVFDARQNIKAAISVSGLVTRMKEIGVQTIVESLQEKCHEIGRLL